MLSTLIGLMALQQFYLLAFMFFVSGFAKGGFVADKIGYEISIMIGA